MSRHFIVIGVLATALAACQGTQDQATISGFATPAANGRITRDLEDNLSKVNRIVRDGDGDGYAFTAGSVDGEGLAAYAGLLPTTSVAPPPVSGTATYDARFVLVEVDDINLDGNFISGTPGLESGDITLRANFDSDRITGRGDGLRVDARTTAFRGLDGSVTWRGVEGDLRGQVGRDKIVGAFHGNNASLIYAGGLLGSPR